jgi:hypothetical protein
MKLSPMHRILLVSLALLALAGVTAAEAVVPVTVRSSFTSHRVFITTLLLLHDRFVACGVQRNVIDVESTSVPVGYRTVQIRGTEK